MALQQAFCVRNFALKNVRGFAAAAAKPSSSSSLDTTSHLIPREDVKIGSVGNVTVASVETNKALAKVAVYFKAGSRFETDETQGVTQMLRICAGLGTEHMSHFVTTRMLESSGANLYCTTGREYISYTVESSRDNLHNVERFIRELAVSQVFKPWEVSDNVPRLRLERATRAPEVRALDLIHKSAYRKGLGYSLFSPKWMIGNHSPEMLSNFVKQNFVEATLVGVGVNHDQLKAFAQQLQTNDPVNPRTISKSKFHPGSELRKETNDELAYVALACEGAAVSDQKKQIASALVQRALGSGKRTKRGHNLGGKLSSIVAGDLSSKASVTAFNANYSDSGLVGVLIAATPCSIESVTKKAAETLLAGGFTDQDASRAKAQLKADVAFATETDQGMLEEIGLQTLLTGSVSSPSEIESAIDSVSASDMNSVIKSGISMACFGNVAKVPYIDQLKK